MERFNGKLVRIYEIHGETMERLCYMRVKRAHMDTDNVMLEGVIVSFELNKDTGRLVVDTKKASTPMPFVQYEELQVISDSELSGIAQATFEVALYKAGILS